MRGMATSSSSAARKRTSSSRPRSSSRTKRDVPATADMTPPPERPAVPDTPAGPELETTQQAPGEGVVGENLLGGSDVQQPGVVEQQAERAAMSMLRTPGSKELFDAATGKTPDPEGMFAAVGHSGTVFVCRVRLMERLWVNSASTVERLVIPAGRQVSGVAAQQVLSVVRAQQSRAG